MTDQRFTTEEAERIAFAIQGRAMEVTGAGELVYDEELRDAAAALRSLAAERDRQKGWLVDAGRREGELETENERLREALRVAARQMHCATTLRHPNDNECHCPGCEAARTALGEEDR